MDHHGLSCRFSAWSRSEPGNAVGSWSKMIRAWNAFHLGVGERVTGVGSLLVQAGPEGVGLDDVREFLRVAAVTPAT